MRIGVDTGGTFTDVAVLGSGGTIETYKLPSTPDDPGRAVGDGVRRTRNHRSVANLIHGTTVATNALLEMSGPPVALLVTAGFRDVLEIARQERPSMFDLLSQRLPPLAPRWLRFEVVERMGPNGVPMEPLQDDSVLQAANGLIDAGVSSVAICFLHSYANAIHEKRAREVLREVLPYLDVTISSEIVPEFKEYERMSTAVVNAYVRPPMRRYLERLGASLRGEGISTFQVMQSSGGMITAEAAADQPVRTVLSGPAAGALAGAQTGAAAGFPKVMSVDMGGTSFDISVAVEDGLLARTESEVAGRAIKVPTIDIHTLGAGGGSIAWIDEGGGLQVGPRSSGAVPGPACYGLGGTEPTVTDANVVLGRFDARGLLGGALRLEVDAAKEAIHSIARPLGLTVERTAEGIVEVVNAAMVGGMRQLSVERGHDPREFALVAFGGGGPAHAVDLARALEMRAVVIPPYPGLHSAVGLLHADHRRDLAATVLTPLVNIELLTKTYEDLTREALAAFEQDGVASSEISIVWLADVRYRGQGETLAMTLAASHTHEELRMRFDDLHRRAYGFASEHDDVEVVNARLVATVRSHHAADASGSHDTELPPSSSSADLGAREVIFSGSPVLTGLYSRQALAPGALLQGPAIIHQDDCTIVVPPEHDVRIDIHGNAVITSSAGGLS